MRVEDLESPLFLAGKRGRVRIQALDDLGVVRRPGHRCRVAVGDHYRECPVGPSVAVIRGYERPDVLDPPGLHLLFQNWKVILAEEANEFVLESPLDAIEVPDCSFTSRRGLRGWRLRADQRVPR